MKVLNPSAFWWLLVLAPLVIVLVSNHLQGRSTFQALTGRWRNQQTANAYMLKSFFTTFFYLLGILFLIIAMSDPAWGNKPVKEDREGLEIVFLVDISRSMLADDGQGSRLEKSVGFMNGMIQYFPEAWFGITVFKGQGMKLVPVTEDRAYLSTVLPFISPSLMTTPGTDIVSGLTEARDSFSENDNHNRIIVVFSDGENLEGDPIGIARELNKSGIPVYTIGVGSESGNVIKLPDGELVVDENGHTVFTYLNSTLLENISDASQGRYYYIDDSMSLSNIHRDISSYLSSLDYEGFRLISVPQYGIFLVLALLCFGGYLFVRVKRWKKINS